MIIKVRSTPENWEKETDGRKPNTVRKLDGKDTVQIINTLTGEISENFITDITTHDGRIIISYEKEGSIKKEDSDG